MNKRIHPRETGLCPQCGGSGIVRVGDLENEAEPEPNGESDDDPDPIAEAMAIAEEELDETNPKRLSICVRCGRPVRNHGKQPRFDDQGVPWLECPDGCAPPGAIDGSCVPMDGGLEDSVLDPTKLDPDDALYQAPDD